MSLNVSSLTLKRHEKIGRSVTQQVGSQVLADLRLIPYNILNLSPSHLFLNPSTPNPSSCGPKHPIRTNTAQTFRNARLYGMSDMQFNAENTVSEYQYVLVRYLNTVQLESLLAQKFGVSHTVTYQVYYDYYLLSNLPEQISTEDIYNAISGMWVQPSTSNYKT
ncbi:hypothetical protein BJ508DRAFT_46493 [Ascobolus immersus RN42]|uniref:Uncharacterized protein n=1 Tax=Ascobolus immersus RN42 TaxID=1160509 RepID=A0A3N4IDX7_ASCIM|nr:hypothetical protein BJ508DRAFT_46493 [Ascobolus immersus RN42]